MKTFVKNFKKNDQFYFNGEKHTVIQKTNESDTKDFSIKAMCNGTEQLFWYDELEVETIIPDLLKSIEEIDKLIEKAKTDNRIDVEDLKAEKRNAFLSIKKLKKQCKCVN